MQVAEEPDPPTLQADASPLLPTVTPRLVQVSTRDESATWAWAWEPACLTNLKRHFGATRAHDVTLVLADDPTLSLGIAYPSIEYPDAIGLTRCEGENNVLTCRLSVSEGSPGASLDATMTAAAPYGVEEFYRLRSRQEWELRAGWEWDRFSPFLTREGSEPTPTPVPPTCDVGRITVHVEEPAISWAYEPEYPVAVHQDPTFRGFDILIEAEGGWAEKRQVQLEQECRDGSGTYPEDCPDEAWEWVCFERVLEHHDDPLVRIDMPMRLEDSSVAWIEGYLRQRYYGAARKEPLPWVFHLWQGEAMQVSTGLMEYAGQDPGVHGGRIMGTTRGTPLNLPQVVEQPYSVPVYLLDTTIQK